MPQLQKHWNVFFQLQNLIGALFLSLLILVAHYVIVHSLNLANKLGSKKAADSEFFGVLTLSDVAVKSQLPCQSFLVIVHFPNSTCLVASSPISFQPLCSKGLKFVCRQKAGVSLHLSKSRNIGPFWSSPTHSSLSIVFILL